MGRNASSWPYAIGSPHANVGEPVHETLRPGVRIARGARYILRARMVRTARVSPASSAHDTPASRFDLVAPRSQSLDLSHQLKS